MSEGRIEYYQSKMDGQQRPYAVCSNISSTVKVPLIVEVSPSGTNLEKAVTLVEQIVKFAAHAGKECVAVRPTGRGPGSVYQNYGEVDTFEVIADAMEKFPIDHDRISVTGASMGGAATWYLISHNPDFFAAGAPFCGYCDYRRWEKPGGLAIHMQEWEEPSWIARSAAFLPENFLHTPVWMLHGEWDRAVGGGVPVELSRQMYSLLKKQGCAVKYTELPKTGHSCRTEDIFSRVVPWLLDQKKARDVDKIELATFELRHNRAYWICIDQLETYGGQRGFLKAIKRKPNEIDVITENVHAFSLGPLANDLPGDFNYNIKINGQDVDSARLDKPAAFRQGAGGHWSLGSNSFRGEKHRGSSGPIGDLFHDNALIVHGTLGNEVESHYLALIAKKMADFYRQFNGGVNRGGILGENNVELSIHPDIELTEMDRKANNLILLGRQSSNALLELYGDRLPISFNNDYLTVNGKNFNGEKVACWAVFPHPENDLRCVAVHGGVTADAIIWGNLLNMNLLPDYIVYNGGQVVDWGFWNNVWDFNK